ncbi:MAG: glucose-6-phosphate dehydrogenase [Candidatus Niyogibacteria bacterium]|nr:MAG: glucose-6-phosphate dehydrogenase [Candidatus Niyogibacteria bacterium]
MIIKNSPTILTIFGATGDLAAKKIIPSLWHLFRQGRFPDRFSVMGFSRRNLSREEFKKFIRKTLIKRGGAAIKERDFSRFFETFSYHAGTFEDKKSFRILFEKIAGAESSWGVCANKLFYLAVPPSSYEIIFKNLASVKLNLPCGGNLGWSRLLIEKPFGKDSESARKLQSLLSSYFKEEQIYRIDHYLFKEILQGIENFRFSNNLFENAWDNTMIERIDIRLYESIGVEERGSFYDAVGALRDVGQNHLLIMLAVLAMEYPKNKEADSIRQNRAKILETLAPWTTETVRNNTYRAQYRGYENIKGVRPASNTDTYFALKTELRYPRWKGIPIFMEAGKRMAEARKEIVLTLKHPAICHLCEVGPHEPNKIVFRLEPNDEIIIYFWMKKPGFEQTLERRAFSFFLYEKKEKAQYVEEYAKIFNAAMEGNRAFFIAPGEVAALWKFIDPIESAWDKNTVSLAKYKPGTTPRPAILQNTQSVRDKNAETRMSEIGIIGLGKMGANLAIRLSAKGWRVVGMDHFPDTTKKLEKNGIIGAYSIPEFVKKLSTPRVIWLMVPASAPPSSKTSDGQSKATAGRPAGKPVDEIIFGKEGLARILKKGDIIIDGGNSFYKDSVRRGIKLGAKGIHFLDVGVSGGPTSIQLGKFAIMAGGNKKIYEKIKPIFDAMSDTTSGYMGKIGAGHFTKMIHNGIEYGMMQALAEGFSVLKKAPFEFHLKDVASVYNQNSIITSRLTGWLEEGFKKYGEDLKKASGVVAQTGEGEWTVKTAKELGVPAPIIKRSYLFRVRSKKSPSFTGKILSTLRAVFGGHKI